MIALSTPPVDATIVTLATSRLAALHAHLRRASVAGEDDAVPAALRPAVRAYRVIDAALPQAIRLPSGEERVERGPRDRGVRERYWRVLESAVFTSSSVDELRRRAARMTTPLTGEVRADVAVARVADALASAWGAYGREIWPAASRELAERTRWWADSVAPRSGATISALRRALGVSDSTPVPRVLILPGGADRGGATHRTLAGPLIVVDVGRQRSAELVAVVFEAIAQALDAAAPGGGTLGALRTRLRAAGVPADAVEQTVQATIFALAASVVREEFEVVRTEVGERYGGSGHGPGRLQEVGGARWVGKG